MRRKLLTFIFLTVWSIVDCNERAMVWTSDGNLYLQPAKDKAICLRTHPQSTVFIEDRDIFDILNRRSQTKEVDISTSSDVLSRLQVLESQRLVLYDDVTINVSPLSSRIDGVSNRLDRLQHQIDSWNEDQCNLHTCRNGGTCLDLVGDFHCVCPPNWEGRNCKLDVDECRNFAGTDLGCVNGANCINTPGSYRCQCRAGWFGTHCAFRKRNCSAGDLEMCGHGTCVSVGSGDGIFCICDQGWTTNSSVACLTDVNECDTLDPRCSINPKVECVNLPGSFTCGQCPRGYHGDGFVCYDIDECMTSNGGCSPLVSCHNTIGSRICGSCPSGYEGDGVECSWRGACSGDRGGCHPAARCIENAALGGRTQCECPHGMEGDGYGPDGCYVLTNGTSCESDPCGPRGRCHKLRDGYTCICFRGYYGAHCDVQTRCAINPCSNGGVCRLDDTTPEGFRCECTALYTGSRCQERVLCGSVLRAEEGSLVYPLTNTSSGPFRCAWIIQTVPELVINVTFTRFNVERSPDCDFAFLQIHDGQMSDHVLGRFCGDKLPLGGNFVSSRHRLYLWFASRDSSGGFALRWNSVTPVCGGDVPATSHGSISSPGSPGNYPPNRDCYWHLTTTLGKRIQLHFFQLDLESHDNCNFDYLVIHNGRQTTDQLLEKYCSLTQPAPLLSSGPELLIHFHSDGLSSGKGFQISYAPVEGVPGCGGFFSGDRGEISSPSYEGLYLSNLFCEYKIRTGPGTQIQLDVKLFKLEASIDCKHDYLKIYDGPTAESSIMGTFCGDLDQKTLNSTANDVFVVFRSDGSQSGEGFKISYKVICKYFARGDSGVIKSPGYPFTYPDDRICEYVIETSPGKAILLSFQDFDLESDAHCNYDSIEIRDGLANSRILGKYCGTSVPPLQTSSYNIIYVKFNSDMSHSGGGFYANFTTVDIECGGIYRDSTGTITSGDSGHGIKQTCTWIILAPEGKYLQLKWDRFDIEETTGCDKEYLEMTVTDDEHDTPRKLCGHTAPPTLTVTTNSLQLKFVSDGNSHFSGFLMTFTWTDGIGQCGGNLVQTHGEIYSPGWLHGHGLNLNCVWVITVTTGHQIKLNISHVNIDSSLLRVANGPSASSPLIGVYQGKFNWKSVTSTGNSLYINFVSNRIFGGSRFKIKWDATVAGCGGTFTGSEGSIASPNYPSKYDENSECFYRIVTNQGSRISLKFLDFVVDTVACDDYVEIFDGRYLESPSLGRFCNVTQKNIETSSNFAYIKFRSSMNSGKRFLLSYSGVCHNHLTAFYGVVESLNYPDGYPAPSTCNWLITAPKGSRINVTFTNFDVSEFESWYGEECFDYLLIGKPEHINSSSKLCGLRLPTQITTTGNVLIIKFFANATDMTQLHSGFRLEWLSYGCRHHVRKSMGYLNKTLSSNDHMECEWLIETPAGTNIQLLFAKVYILETSNCTTDSIKVYNGRTDLSHLLATFCQITADGVTLSSSSNYVLVKLVKNSSLKDAHVVATFNSTRLPCGGTFKGQSGIITSKNYPNPYDSNLYCVWTILVQSGHRVTVEFTGIDLGNEYGKCDDYIKVYTETDILNKICNNTAPSNYVSTSNVLFVQFVTNDVKTAKGFKANFATICGGVFNLTQGSTDGVLTTKYLKSSNSSCVWTILAPELEQKVSLMITHLSLPVTNDRRTTQTCPNSYLRVLDGDDENAPLIDEYCGRAAPATIVSRGSALTLVFGTHDARITGFFSAYYSSVDAACGGTFTSESGVIASPNYPAPYPVNVVCEWTLSTSPGNRVSINIDMIDISYSEECNEDYLEVRESDGAGPMLDLYCGSVLPLNAVSASKLYLKFRSDDKSPGRGFLIRYSFLHGNDIADLDGGEIASPLYPHPYDASGQFWWRVTSGNEAILLEIDELQIPAYDDEFCDDNLSIYDGVDDEAPLLKALCGALYNTAEVIRTTSNAAYIKLSLTEANTALFHLRWSRGDRDINQSIDKPNCGNNITVTVTPGSLYNFTSPNYPQHYDNEETCEWVLKASYGQHLSLKFTDFNLEESEPCSNSDFVSIFESDVSAEWNPVKENICLNSDAQQDFNASRFMKIIFRSNAADTRRGFAAVVRSICGANFTAPSGAIQSTPLVFDRIPYRCNWRVKVRPGRRIKLEFVNFEIVNKENDCQSYLMLHDGELMDSPRLSDGKYCGYTYENRNAVITSSNHLLVSFISSSTELQMFELHYEEVNDDCGVTSELNEHHGSETISTKNYPNVPDPYTECNWLFTGPVGEILRVEFRDRFDLYQDEDCVSEFVEIHDGSSAMSPVLGRYCGDIPDTIRTTGNTVFISYVTTRPEPNNGFKANVAIDDCGGTIRASEGEVTSAGYPFETYFDPGAVCEWHIIGSEGHALSIKPENINLPQSMVNCATYTKVEEVQPYSNVKELIKTYCFDDSEDLSVLQTTGNHAVVTMVIGPDNAYFSGGSYGPAGFRLAFKSSQLSCSGEFTTSEGYITTPRYPNDAATKSCKWKITVPDESRRITLKILASTKNSIIISEGGFEENIADMAEYDVSQNNTFKSSGNSIEIFLKRPQEGLFHFKARFSSYDAAVCGGSISGVSGRLQSPKADEYFCKWQFHETFSYRSLYLTGSVSSVNNTKCDKKTKIALEYHNAVERYKETLLCNQNVAYRVTNALELKAMKRNGQDLYFDLQWQLQPCGGSIFVSDTPTNILNAPLSHNGSLDCAWTLNTPQHPKIEITIDGNFHVKCDDAFMKIARIFENKRILLYKYCDDKTLLDPKYVTYKPGSGRHISLLSKNIIIEYHSKQYRSNYVQIYIKTSKCGGDLPSHSQFSSPNFPNGYEGQLHCEWFMKTQLGMRVSLKFAKRFAIEKSPNCTKDAVIIYDWKNDEYIEIARLCGREIPPVFNSTDNKLKVVLRTVNETNLDGFQAMWVAICGITYNVSKFEHYLLSPGYPYDLSPVTCVYKIFASEQLKITFLDFNLEGYPGACEHQNLTIRSGNPSYSQTYCGTEIPTINDLFSDIEIVFQSDSTHKTDEKKGFKIRVAYSLDYCGGHITQPTAISSGDRGYYRGMNCTWLIEAPNNKRIILKVVHFRLEDYHKCTGDHLAVYEGLHIEVRKRLALFCGDVAPSTVISSRGNAMTVEFITDSIEYLLMKGFRLNVAFTYSESVGCGGDIDITSSHTLTSPFIDHQTSYENFLHCQWNVVAPPDHVIKVSFASFHIAPCRDVNRTALVMQCDCDFLQIKDGPSPASLVIGTYCGHTLPADVVSSSNVVTITMSTDGEITSSGFTVNLLVQESVCGASVFQVSRAEQRVKSPGFDAGILPRGIHCAYHFIDSHSEFSANVIHIHFNDFDLQPGNSRTVCDRDKIYITSALLPIRQSLGNDYIHGSGSADSLGQSMIMFELFGNATVPEQYVICGTQKSVDIIVYGSFYMNLITSPGDAPRQYEGIDVEVSLVGFCGRNYTGLYGRVISKYYVQDSNNTEDCYTLIRVPENYTISLYPIMCKTPSPNSYLDIHDGNTTASAKVLSFENSDSGMNPVFSTDRYIMLHSHLPGLRKRMYYQFTYIATDKGRGCGGYFYGDRGVITSPLYPNVYRKLKTCTWELETPHGTRVSLLFQVFDLGGGCEHNYVQLVDRAGTMSTYCSETPAVFVGVDNYVRVVSVTSRTNEGTGWRAIFVNVL